MYRYKKFMSTAAMVVILLFSFRQNVSADPWLVVQAVNPLRAVAPTASYWGLVASGYSLALTIAPVIPWVPIATVGVVVVAVAAAGYLIYTINKDDKKRPNTDGSISVPGKVQWVDLNDFGLPVIKTADTAATVGLTELDDIVLKDAASKAASPNLAHVLSDFVQYTDISIGSQVGSNYFVRAPGNCVVTGVEFRGNSWAQDGTGGGPDGQDYHSAGGSPERGYVDVSHSQAATGGCWWTTFRFQVTAVASPQVRRPADQIKAAVALTSTDGNLNQAQDDELDKLLDANPNIVHFPDLPDTIKAATPDAISQAYRPITAADAGQAATAATKAADAANTAVDDYAKSHPGSTVANDPVLAGLAGTADTLNAAASTAVATQTASTDASLPSTLSLAGILAAINSLLKSVTDFFTEAHNNRISDDLAVRTSPMPVPVPLGNYSGGRINPASLPEKKDIKSGLTDFLAHSPVVSMIKGIVVSTSNDDSDMSFDFHGHRINASFGHWDSIIGGVGTTLLVITHGLGMLIIFRRE